jgi:hypothetical protein
MSRYTRPRLTLVVDEDVVELAKKLAELEERPVATYAALLLNKVIRELAAQKGLTEKKLTKTDRKT